MGGLRCQAADANCWSGQRFAQPIWKAEGIRKVAGMRSLIREFVYEEGSIGALVSMVIWTIAAWLAGRAIARTWRPFWHVLIYMALLAAALRFLRFALFEETLLSPIQYAIEA